METPNAPAPEESLSLSFDEGSNNFNNNNHQKTKGNTKTLAPHFKQTPNPTKPVSNKSNSSKVPRQPFKQITPQDQVNSPNGLLNRGKPVLTSGNQVTRKREDKENTPLTSKYVAQGNIDRKSPCASTVGNVESFSERNEKVHRSQSFGNHQRRVLSDQNPSNRRVSMEVTQVKKRKRYNSEEVQSHQILQQPVNRTRANSHSSLTPSALSDDDSPSNISLDSSITKNNEMRRLPSQSPSNLNKSNQLSPKRFSKSSPSNSEYLPETCMSKQQTDGYYSDHVTNQPSKRDSCKLKYQSSPDDVKSKKQNNSKVCQNSSNFSGNVSSHGKSAKLTNHDIQCAAVTSEKSKRQSRSGASSRQRQVSDMVMRQPLPKNSDTLRNNLKQCDSRDSFNSGHTMYGAPRDVIKVRTNQPSVIPSHQQNVFAKSRDLSKQPSNRRFVGTDTDATETKYDHMIFEETADTFMKADSESSTKYNNQKSSLNGPSSESLSASDHQESENKSEKCSQQQSPHACNDPSRQISPDCLSKDSSQHSPSRYAPHRPNSELASKPGDFVFANVETQRIGRLEANQQQKKEEKHSSNLELEQQVKRQEDMIRVLQEQVSLRIGFSAGGVLKFSKAGVNTLETTLWLLEKVKVLLSSTPS